MMAEGDSEYINDNNVINDNEFYVRNNYDYLEKTDPDVNLLDSVFYENVIIIVNPNLMRNSIIPMIYQFFILIYGVQRKILSNYYGMLTI